MKPTELLAITAALLPIAACGSSSVTVAPAPRSPTLSAPATAPVTPSTSTTTARLGTAVQLSLVRLTALSKEGNVVSENPLETPNAGNQYLALEVLYVATGTVSISYSPFTDWKIRDFTGREFPATYVSGRSPELQAGELAPGERAQGWITFEIPAGATGLTAIVKVGGETAAFTL
jgi:hypothetical protein